MNSTKIQATFIKIQFQVHNTDRYDLEEIILS